MDSACDLLKPYDASLMQSYSGNARVNSVANDDEGCSAPAGVIQAQASLFS
ncbi:MAG: hypothetical protein WB919_03905 [Candidatus Sulfotelmatobacter sp.]